MTLFTVTNPDGSTPDLKEIALGEKWAQGLVWCDMEGFALMDDGTLVLLDECGNAAYPPRDRFVVTLTAGDAENCAQVGQANCSRHQPGQPQPVVPPASETSPPQWTRNHPFRMSTIVLDMYLEKAEQDARFRLDAMETAIRLALTLLGELRKGR